MTSLLQAHHHKAAATQLLPRDNQTNTSQHSVYSTTVLVNSRPHIIINYLLYASFTHSLVTSNKAEDVMYGVGVCQVTQDVVDQFPWNFPGVHSHRDKLSRVTHTHTHTHYWYIYSPSYPLPVPLSASHLPLSLPTAHLLPTLPLLPLPSPAFPIPPAPFLPNRWRGVVLRLSSVLSALLITVHYAEDYAVFTRCL